MPDSFQWFRSSRILTAVAIALAGAGSVWAYEEWKSGIAWEEPVVVTPGDATVPPSDAIVLFDGSSMDAWTNSDKWQIENGYAIAGGVSQTKQKFGDCQLHIEFATPSEVVGKGQGRGNNGVYLMGRYELQVLDSYQNPTYFDGQCGAVYKQHPPLVNACRQPGEWQTYDIIFTAPRFHKDKTLKTPGYMTVLQNGVLVQNHFEIQGATKWDEAPAYSAHSPRESLSLGYHGNPVRFRNIWIRDLMEADTSSEGDKKKSE